MEELKTPYPTPDPDSLTGAVYGVLALLGAVLGVVGSFEFSWTVGDVPVAALLLSVFGLAAFRLAGWVMEGRLGAVVPAVAWLIVVVVLSAKRPEGDLVVTGTTAGYVYIFGGSIAAVAAIMWTRSPHPRMLGGVSPTRGTSR